MVNPVQQIKQHPPLLILCGAVLLIGAAALTLSGNILCLSCLEGSLLQTVVVMLCTNLWVIAAPFGLLLLTCGMLGQYCALRRHLPG
jgi:hypothetical protein